MAGRWKDGWTNGRGERGVVGWYDVYKRTTLRRKKLERGCWTGKEMGGMEDGELPIVMGGGGRRETAFYVRRNSDSGPSHLLVRPGSETLTDTLLHCQGVDVVPVRFLCAPQ